MRDPGKVVEKKQNYYLVRLRAWKVVVMSGAAASRNEALRLAGSRGRDSSPKEQEPTEKSSGLHAFTLVEVRHVT